MGRSDKGEGGDGFNTPFRKLAGRLARRKKEPERPAERELSPTSDSPPGGRPEDESDLFARAMSGVTPLEGRDERRPAPAPPRALAGDLPSPDPDAEAYDTLSKFVAGEIPFDIADTDEYVEGYVEGFDRRVLGKLRRGEFSVQAHLDLHNMSRAEARSSVESFVTESLGAGLRCVLIVHGRGHHSPDQIPVLKNMLRAWLSRGRIGRA
ncbi:MAG: Smr/MutS family protein, partial [Deltaproteobacteria bacterium]|nr:Smr/MutS family protein [Deltaproteobacteria bacterium]